MQVSHMVNRTHSERRSYYQLFCWLFTWIENFYYPNYSHSVFKNVLSCKSAKSQQGTFNFKTFFPLFSLSLQFFVWCYMVKKLWLQKYTVLRFILIFVWSCFFWTFWLMISIMFFKERTSLCGGHNLPPPWLE